MSKIILPQRSKVNAACCTIFVVKASYKQQESRAGGKSAASPERPMSWFWSSSAAEGTIVAIDSSINVTDLPSHYLDNKEITTGKILGQKKQ